MLTVTYIGHSGFLIETDNTYFLFDYFNGEIPSLKSEKSIVVFSSHRHHDHFNPEIFELIQKHPDILYVLSYDIPLRSHINKYNNLGIDLRKNIIAIKKNITQLVTLPNGKNLKITTLRSTDEGVAFFLEYDNHIFYHAGDLNCWDWIEESKAYRNNMIKLYTDEIKKIAGQNIDIAFVPLDPRLEKTAYEGLEIFINYTNSKVIFPMHCWDNYTIIDDFLTKHPECKDQVSAITSNGEIFIVK